MPNATSEEFVHAVNAMVAAAEDFAGKHAPGQAYIVQSHLDRFHPHAHLILCASNGKKCVDWGPDQLRGFQSLDFLSPTTQNKYSLQPGRGQGRRPKGVGRISYDHATAGEFNKTHETKTAEQFSYEAVLAGIEAGTVEVTRRTKKGKPLSVSLNGKTIRLSTLRKSQLKPLNGDSNNDTTGPNQNRSHRMHQRGRNRNRPMVR